MRRLLCLLAGRHTYGMHVSASTSYGPSAVPAPSAFIRCERCGHIQRVWL